MRQAITISMVASILLASCAKEQVDPSQWPISRSELERGTAALDPGEAAYQRTCIACHMRDGRGNGGVTAADLTSPTGILSQPDDAVRAVIRDGRRTPTRTMPAHGAILTAAEIDSLIAYLRREIAPNVHPIEDAGVPDDASPATP